jgi:class 3 adenylate cyclase
MSEIRENDVVALVNPRPEVGLQRGDVGNVIQVFDETPQHPAGFIVEFVDESGAVRAETDITDPSEIVKLRLNPKGTLEEWVGSFSLLVIVFTDIIESAALSNELGHDHWLDLLNLHFANARKIANECGGYEIKVIGDSYMVAFRTAVKALDFAVAFQKNTGDRRVNIRAGVHAGTARIIDDDIIGLDDDILGIMVNYTPRVKKESYSSWLMLSNDAKKYLEDEPSASYDWLNFIPQEVRLQNSTHSWRLWVASLLESDSVKSS